MTSPKIITTRPIKGILFDVDGTFYHQTPLRGFMILNLIFSNLFSPGELTRKTRVILQYRKSQETLRASQGLENGNRENQLLLTAHHTKETIPYISEVVEEWLEKRPLAFIRFCRRHGLEKSLGLLQNKGIKLGVFSDYPANKKLEALGISRFFSTVVSSSDQEVYGFKPRTNGFIIAASRMGLEPSEILYVGDRPEIDGEGGCGAGMPVAILGGLFNSRSREYPSFNSFSELLVAIG